MVTMNLIAAASLFPLSYISAPDLAQDTEVMVAKDTVLPMEPIFVRLTSAAEPYHARGLAVIGHVQSAGSTYQLDPISLWRFDYREDKVEMWFALLTPDNVNNEQILVQLVDHDGLVLQELQVVIAKLSDEAAKAMRLFDEADGPVLVGTALEQDTLRLKEKTRAKLLGLAASYRGLPYGRMAQFVLGAYDFQLLESEFNINGPPKCFAQCYALLESVVQPAERDPIFAEAARRLTIAKAWSSDYGDAAALAGMIITSGVSEASAAFAHEVLEELNEFPQEREAKLKARQRGSGSDKE